MQSLPEQFPIRYAIISNPHLAIESSVDITEGFSVRSQFLHYLQDTPILSNNLNLFCYGVEHRDIDNNLVFQLYKLEGSEEWVNDISQKFSTIVPSGPSITSRGRAYQLTAISYKGMAEIPLFWQIMKMEEQDKFLRKYNFSNVRRIKQEIIKLYDLIISNQNLEFERKVESNRDLMKKIMIPTSKLWAYLSAGNLDGYARHEDFIDGNSEAYENKNSEGYLEVVLAPNLLVLLKQEMWDWYKSLNFCNSCRKPLPFKYKGKYCPDLIENQHCIRERARLRKRKA